MKKTDRRSFLKLGFVGVGAFLASMAPVKMSTSDPIKIGSLNVPTIGSSEAHAACGIQQNCSGGGGMCGLGLNCSGGGGMCGSGSCSGN
ncbi:MAG: hypothetical protein IJU76_01925 [Desulfovibrionaceae bacterium]|nr:hypothetical protein [Desulfovibrionaceae bacterium]